MGFQRGQRSRLFVSRSIQGIVMGRFALYWIGYHFALWHGMLLYGYVRGNMFQTFLTGSRMSFWEYYVKFFQANSTILICAAAICPIMLWDTLRVTHRIAGPVERFKSVLKKLARGEEVKEVQLREKDLLEDLRVAFNEFLASRDKSPRTAGKLSTTELVALDRMLEQVANESENAATV